MKVKDADLQNPSFTVALVEGFTGLVGDDVDLDNDGILDNLAVLGNVLDAIGVTDSVHDQDLLYGEHLGGQDFGFIGDEPSLVFRESTVGSWFAIASPATDQIFDINGNDVSALLQIVNGNPFVPSFGAINPGLVVVPEPSSLTILAGLLGGIALQRRRGSRSARS